jgi:hypothetical protein
MSIALALVFEILIGGTICSFWILLFINRILGYGIDNIAVLLSKVGNLGLIGLLIAIIVIYVIGWISQYVGYLIFDRIQAKFSYAPFTTKEDFGKARSRVFQLASKTVIDDIQLDRQILRISKHVCFNCAITGLLIWLYANTIWAVCLITCIGCFTISVLSFMHWKKRYADTMKKFYGANKALSEEKAKE